jgi:hypothetical protein
MCLRPSPASLLVCSALPVRAFETYRHGDHDRRIEPSNHFPRLMISDRHVLVLAHLKPQLV